MRSYNYLRDLSKSHNIAQNTAPTTVTGAVAVIITVYAIEPFDTVKTRAHSAVGASPVEALTSVLCDSGIRYSGEGAQRD